MSQLRFMGTPPTKNHPSDAGYDLTLTSLLKAEKGVYYYDTGTKIALPEGYWGMLVGRSSIAKTGHMLANNVGVIDNHYRGNIIVALIKRDATAPDLTLPCRLVQFIPMKQYDFTLEEVVELSSTDRADSGGLGSKQFADKVEK